MYAASVWKIDRRIISMLFVVTGACSFHCSFEGRPFKYKVGF
jgi:hypothetical protein